MSTPTPPSLLPPGARVVVVWDQWLATKTLSGAPEPVTLRPLPGDGQDVDGDGLPIVRDADDRLQASLHTWTAQPAAGDGVDVESAGWVAFPALADDTALGRWGGWELTYGDGTDARTLRIGVPGSITPTPVPAALLSAVADTCARTGATNPLASVQAGDLVRQLYVYDAPRVTPPVVITPDRVYTADRVDEIVGTGLDDLRAHVDDEDARLRSLVGAITGDTELGGLGPLATSTDAALLTGLIDLARLPSTVARITDVQAMLAALLGGTLAADVDTLVEIVALLRNDQSGLASLATQMATKVALADLSAKVMDLLVQGANTTITRDLATGKITIASTATGGGSGGPSVSAADVRTIVANGLGTAQVDYSEAGTPQLALKGTSRVVVRDIGTATGTLNPALAATDPVTVIRGSWTTGTPTLNIGVPSGTPPSVRAKVEFQIVNQGTVDLSVNLTGLGAGFSNPSGQPLPVTVKAGTAADGAFILRQVSDGSTTTSRWAMPALLPETPA